MYRACHQRQPTGLYTIEVGMWKPNNIYKNVIAGKHYFSQTTKNQKFFKKLVKKEKVHLLY